VFKAFTEHPDSVGETYLEHMGTAWSFARTLAAAAIACFLHGLLPFAFQTTASRRIRQLYDRMITHRVRKPAPDAQPGEYVLAFDI
jgi:hypothetical protein